MLKHKVNRLFRSNVLIKHFLFMLIFWGLVTPACAEKIIIGTLKYNPPFEIENNGHFFGFEIELLQEICKRNQFQCEFKGMEFQQLFNSITNNNIDLAIGAIIISPERNKNFLFSLPYKISHLQFVIQQKTKMTNIKELLGKTIAAYLDSPSIAYIKNYFNNQIHIKTFPNSMAMLQALNNNQVDAVLTNYSQATFWISNDQNYKLLGEKFRVGEGYAIMANFNQKTLISKINKTLLEMEGDGSYLKIYESTYD